MLQISSNPPVMRQADDTIYIDVTPTSQFVFQIQLILQYIYLFYMYHAHLGVIEVMSSAPWDAIPVRGLWDASDIRCMSWSKVLFCLTESNWFNWFIQSGKSEFKVPIIKCLSLDAYWP